MQAFTKHFLCLALLLPFQVMIANTPVQSCEQVQAKSQFVYLSTEMRRAVECLHRMLPEHKWSPEFKDVCDRIAKDGIAAPAEQAEAVVVECLNLLDGQNCAELQEVQEAIKRYAEALRKGDATIVLVDEAMVTRACGSCNTDCNTTCNSKCIKYEKSRAFCNLFAHDLQVDGSGYIANLTSNQLRVTGNANISGDLTVDGAIFTSSGTGTDVFDNLTVNGIFTANGVSNIGTNDTANAINIGTAAAGRAIAIGNLLGATSVGILSGTGDVTLQSADDVVFNPAGDLIASVGADAQLDATSTFDINASAGPINIGNDPVAQPINIGTGAAARTITVGNVTGATAVNLTSGTGGFSAQSTGTINVGTNATAQTINIGNNNAVDKDIVIGSTAAGSTITLATPTNVGVSLGVGQASIISGAGAPAFVAPQGTIYLNTTGATTTTRLYINTTGSNVWANFTASA